MNNTNGNQRVVQSPATVTLDQTNQGSSSQTIDIGLANTGLDLGLTDAGYCFAQNLNESGSDYISLGSNTSEYLVRLMPNEMALFPLESGVTVNAVASAANTPLFIQAIER